MITYTGFLANLYVGGCRGGEAHLKHASIRLTLSMRESTDRLWSVAWNEESQFRNSSHGGFPSPPPLKGLSIRISILVGAGVQGGFAPLWLI